MSEAIRIIDSSNLSELRLMCKGMLLEQKATALQLRTQDEALAAIATIAHSGGLVGMSGTDAMNAIRRLSLPYWGKQSTADEVRAALAKVKP